MLAKTVQPKYKSTVTVDTYHLLFPRLISLLEPVQTLFLKKVNPLYLCREGLFLIKLIYKNL